MPATLELIGRDAELAHIADFVAAISAGPSALILEGEPGIGKTALWTSALARTEVSIRVLKCQAARPETELSLAGLSDLLNPVIDVVLPALPIPLARALEIALLRVEAGTMPLEQRTLMTAFAQAIRILSGQGPLLIAIDDMQWLDRETAAILAFGLRRLDGEPVRVLASLRASFDGQSAANPLMGMAPHLVTTLSIGPMPAAALTRMLRSRVSADMSWPVARRIHDACQGNPLHALELARVIRPHSHSIDEPLRVPPSLRQLVTRRLAALPDDTNDALLLASATPAPLLPRLALALGQPSAEPAIQPALDAGIVTIVGETVAFEHPLWPTAAYSSASASRRRRAHKRLAGVTGNREERARHLALAAQEPDERVAAALGAVAKTAAARGAMSSAAELTGLAARLSPDEALRLSRSVDAAKYLYEAGDSAQARKSLEKVVAQAPSGAPRARALLALGQVRVFDLDAAPVLAILREALRQAAEDEVLQAEIHVAISWVCESDLDAGLAHAKAAEALLAGRDEPELLATILHAQLMFENLTGEGMSDDLAARALELERRAPSASVAERPSFQIAAILVTHDRLDEARARLSTALGDIPIELPATARLEVVSALVHTEVLAGNWESAQRWAENAAADIELTGPEDQRSWTTALEAEVDAVRGRTAEARAKATEVLRQSVEAGSPFGQLRALPILGFLALSEDDPAQAVGYLSQADEWCERIGLREPGRFRFLADYAEALIATGDLERAAEVTDRLDVRGRRLGRKWALATSARCGALIAMARGDAEHATALVQAALCWHDGLPMPFELGRTHLIAGEIHRRAKHKRAAAGHMQTALEIFVDLGAPLWSRRARTELSRVGVRTGSALELTETERQVAELAASGLTNREVAARMFLSLRTVESSLSRTYRKLGIRSRTELARRSPIR